MDVRYEYHVQDVLTFTADEREEYFAAVDAYQKTVEDNGGDATGITPVDRNSYYLRNVFDPAIVKLTFDRPSKIFMYGVKEKDSVAFDNTYEEGKWTSGRWIQAGAMIVDGRLEINQIKGISPVIYLRLGEGGPISVYAEK